MDTLSLETKKRLTIFLGECWHEEGPLTGYEHHRYRCIKCNKPLVPPSFGVSSSHNYLDFSDWRVIGRLIEKVNKIESDDCYTPEYLMWLDLRDALHKENIPLAICMAIDTFLIETEGK